MKTVRFYFTAAVAMGLIVSTMAASSLADDKHGHDDDKHDHGAMKSEKKIAEALKSLPGTEAKQAAAQRFCPLMERHRLGAMGAPLKVTLNGQSVFVCCKGCVKDAQKAPKETLAKVKKLTRASATLAKLPANARAAAEEQKYCAVMNTSLLGAMGAPIKVELNGKSVLLCCKGCVKKAKADPAGTLAAVASLKKAGSHGEHGHGDHKHGDHKHEK
jgi:hypothetical protein